MKLIRSQKVLILVILLVLSIILNPIYFIITHRFLGIISHEKPNLTQPENILRVGVMGVGGDWDPAITPGYFLTTSTYLPNCMETLTMADGKWDDVVKEIVAGLRPEEDRWKEWWPVLATNWTVEYWPEEMNALGFVNRGGVKSITYTLRENVDFTDGSAWNATVAKWNLDRLFIISSDASGLGDLRNKDIYWTKIKDVERYFSPSWNLTARGYSPTTMGWYYDGTTNWTAGDASLIGTFPILEGVEILVDQPYGGKIKLKYNSWNTYVTEVVGLLGYMSMDYYKNYYTKGIYGFTSTADPRSPDITQHLVGTGPYIYQNDHNNTAGAGGTMGKNYNYWNRTALEAAGWFDAEFVEILSYPLGDLGTNARNIALLVNAIDYSFDTPTSSLDYDAIMANPNISYIEYGINDYMTSLTLNAINETWMSWYIGDVRNPTGLDYASMIESTFPVAGGNKPNGLPRDLRKAMSYAFEYDTYINTVLDGRSVRSGGLLGKDNIYYNASVPIADYNVTYAREILLNSVPDIRPAVGNVGGFGTYTNFSQLAIDAGLDENSTDLDWASVASITTGPTPLWTLDMYYDTAFTPLRNILITSLAKIGVAVTTDPTRFITTYMWDPISHYYDGTFPVFSAQAWPFDWNVPDTIPEEWIEAEYFDPNRGSWRTNPLAPIEPGFELFPWFNLHFAYDTDIDYWLERIPFSNTTEKFKLLNKIAEKVQTELYPMIYVSQGKEGRVLWNDWENNFNRGDLFFANFRYKRALQLPGDIALSSDAGTTDIDGNFNLIWNVSLGANNYSIYRYSSEITQINGSLTIIVNQTATSPFLISGLLDGDYHFVVVAHNQYGDTMSNNIHMTVLITQIPPSSFILSTNADFPDDDGFFNLNWTTSDGADNYSLYMDNNPITVLDSSITLLLDQTAISPFPVSGLPNGEYYFVVVAHNQYSDTLSNNIHVTVNIPGEPTATAISSYNTLVLMGIAVCTAVILLKKMKKKSKR